MNRGALFFLLVAGCSGCPNQTPPAPTDTSVYQTLVTAGCMKADDAGDGVTAVAQEHALPTPPAWLSCLYQGGTVQSCGVPCDGGGK